MYYPACGSVLQRNKIIQIGGKKMQFGITSLLKQKHHVCFGLMAYLKKKVYDTAKDLYKVTYYEFLGLF